MIEASPAKLLFQSFRDRNLESRDASQQDCRIAKMTKCETRFGSACGHSHWSHRKKMEEGSSASKLNFGVLGIST
jgi:hypothetical protein